MTVQFKNRGLIDLRAVRTIGLNAKPKSDNPIGEFGTGLKLAISVILRNGGTVTLWRGKTAHTFGTVATKFRGEDVTLDGEELGFTLNYGKNWKPWQAFRELYSNMLDEPEGACSYTTGSGSGEKGYTTITVEGCEFDELYENRRSVFLEGDPLLKVPGLEVHFGRSKVIYYNGMRAMDLPKESNFTYNITRRMTLTEDRTFMYPHMAPHYTVRSLTACDNAEVLQAVLGAGDDDWEGRFEYNLDSHDDVSGTFMRVAADMKARRVKMAGGAGKLFSDRDMSTSTFGMARLREPTPVEVAHFERALEMIRLKLPNIDILPCLVHNSVEKGRVYASRDCIELVADCAELEVLDLAVMVVAALCTRNGGDEPSADAVARMFLLGSFEVPEEEPVAPDEVLF